MTRDQVRGAPVGQAAGGGETEADVGLRQGKGDMGHVFRERARGQAVGCHHNQRHFRLMANHLPHGAEQIHPLIRTHPVSGRKALYFHPGKTARIEGMGHDESLVFLNELLDRVIQPDVTYRHQWRVGDMLLLDNRAVLHIALDDYDHAEGRVMHRILLAGDVPN